MDLNSIPDVVHDRYRNKYRVLDFRIPSPGDTFLLREWGGFDIGYCAHPGVEEQPRLIVERITEEEE